MQHRLEETAGILIKAFFHGHLVHGEPCACAVGNMCNGNPYWINVINGTHQQIYHKVANKPIPEYVRYTPEELMRIEYEFEGREDRNGHHLPTLFKDNDPDGFEGLTRVFNILCNEIDKGYFELPERINIIDLVAQEKENWR